MNLLLKKNCDVDSALWWSYEKAFFDNSFNQKWLTSGLKSNSKVLMDIWIPEWNSFHSLIQLQWNEQKAKRIVSITDIDRLINVKVIQTDVAFGFYIGIDSKTYYCFKFKAVEHVKICNYFGVHCSCRLIWWVNDCLLRVPLRCFHCAMLLSHV